MEPTERLLGVPGRLAGGCDRPELEVTAGTIASDRVSRRLRTGPLVALRVRALALVATGRAELDLARFGADFASRGGSVVGPMLGADTLGDAPEVNATDARFQRWG